MKNFTKGLISMLSAAMLLGGTQAFAAKLPAPIDSREDLMTYAGVAFEKEMVDGELTYNISEDSKEGAKEIHQAAIEENNRRIQKLWKENALSKFAEEKKLNIAFDSSEYSLVQFNCTLSDMTVEELSAKLRRQVIQKTDKNHKHEWMYFDVTDQDGNEKLFRYCQTCEKWQVFDQE